MKKSIVAVVAFVTGMYAMVGAAYAQSASDLTGVTAAAESTKDEVQTWVTTVGLPILFGLLLLGIGIKLAMKFVRRGARAA